MIKNNITYFYQEEMCKDVLKYLEGILNDKA